MGGGGGGGGVCVCFLWGVRELAVPTSVMRASVKQNRYTVWRGSYHRLVVCASGRKAG